MGGGNAQKTAMSRERNNAKAAKEKAGGGGLKAMEGETLQNFFFNFV